MRIKQHGNLYQLTFLPRLFPINAYVYETADALIVLDLGVSNFVKSVQAIEAKTAKPVTTTSESAVSSAPVSTQERRVETQTVQPVQSNEGIRQGRFN